MTVTRELDGEHDLVDLVPGEAMINPGISGMSSTCTSPGSS